MAVERIDDDGDVVVERLVAVENDAAADGAIGLRVGALHAKIQMVRGGEDADIRREFGCAVWRRRALHKRLRLGRRPNVFVSGSFIRIVSQRVRTNFYSECWHSDKCAREQNQTDEYPGGIRDAQFWRCHLPRHGSTGKNTVTTSS